MKINEKIRTLREINNLTQEDMAKQLHMSTTGYANYERGEAKIHFQRLEQIADVLGMSVVDLVSFGEKNSVFCLVGENTINNAVSVIGSSGNTELAHEVSKLQLQLSHSQEINQRQQQEISQLKEMIELLKR